MRGQPIGHPDWTIDTEIIDHERGKRTSATRVDGGYVLVRAKVFDETGRLIATGVKSEYSENFPDYVEKAETGAIARALAVAGYGTESALDLDEGIEGGRIADSPVATPIITASAITGVGRGGTSATATDPQVREVARLARDLGLDAQAIVDLVQNYTKVETPLLPADPDLQSQALRALFTRMSGTDIGAIVNVLRLMKEQEDGPVMEVDEEP
jgi:hypothetical protein